MIVTPTVDFNKSIRKLEDKTAKKRLSVLIDKLERVKDLTEISNVASITNHPELYRIRTGDYRLIVRYRNGEALILLIEYLKRNEKTYRKYK